MISNMPKTQDWVSSSLLLEPSLRVADGSHKNVDMPMDYKRVIANLIEVKRIPIRACSMFVRHRYLQHYGTAWSGMTFILYHMSLIPQVNKLMDAASFAWVYGFRKTDESRQLLSSIFDVFTVLLVSKPSSTVYSQGRADGDNRDLGSTAKQDKMKERCLWIGPIMTRRIGWMNPHLRSPRSEK